MIPLLAPRVQETIVRGRHFPGLLVVRRATGQRGRLASAHRVASLGLHLAGIAHQPGQGRDVEVSGLVLQPRHQAHQAARGLAEEHLGADVAEEDSDPQARDVDALRDHLDRDDPGGSRRPESADSGSGVGVVGGDADRRPARDPGQDLGQGPHVGHVPPEDDPTGLRVLAAQVHQVAVGLLQEAADVGPPWVQCRAQAVGRGASAQHLSEVGLVLFASALPGELAVVVGEEDGGAVAVLQGLAVPVGEVAGAGPEVAVGVAHEGDLAVVAAEGRARQQQATGGPLERVAVDLVKDHQVAGFFIKRNLQSGTNLVVIDSKENGLDKQANKTIKPAAGTFEDVLKAISAAVVKLGLAKGKTNLKASDLDSLAATTKVKSEDYLDAAFILASAVDPVIVYGQRANLGLLREFAGLIGAKLISLKGEANSLVASQLGLDTPYKPADYKAAIVALGDGDLSQKMIQEIEKIPFKVVQASYASSLTANADVVFPSTTWLEQSGHYLTADGRMLEARKSLEPAEEILSIETTLEKLAEKMGMKLDHDFHKAIHRRVAPVELNS